MPLTEISNTSAVSRGKVSSTGRDFGAHHVHKAGNHQPTPLAEIIEEAPIVSADAPLLSILDFLQKDAAAANAPWICLLCNVHDISDRMHHVGSASHQNRETLILGRSDDKSSLGRSSSSSFLTFDTPQFNSNKGCFKICPYRWTTCRLLSQNNKIMLHPPPGRMVTSISTDDKSALLDPSKKAQPLLEAQALPRDVARAPRSLSNSRDDVRFACISPSSSNSSASGGANTEFCSWSCGLCDVHGLKAAAFWLHCLGDQHTAASQMALEDQLFAAAANFETELLLANQQNAQGEIEWDESFSTAEGSIRAGEKMQLVEVSSVEVESAHDKQSSDSLLKEEPGSGVQVFEDAHENFENEPDHVESLFDKLSEQDAMEVFVLHTDIVKSEESSVVEQAGSGDIEAESGFTESFTDDELVGQELERDKYATDEEPFDGIAIAAAPPTESTKHEDASKTEEPELIDPSAGEVVEQSSIPFTATKALTAGELLERSASLTRNKDSIHWSCSLCGISDLQAHSVKSHCLGKKHNANFDQTRQLLQLPPAPEKESLSASTSLEQALAFDNTLEEAARTDESYTFINLADENISWSCSMCKIQGLHMKDVVPHCMGKRHKASFRAQKELLLLVALPEKEAISTIEPADVPFISLERRPSAVLVQAIIEEAESKEGDTHPVSPTSSDTSDNEDQMYFVSTRVEDDRDLSFREVFNNQHDDDALLEFDSWTVEVAGSTSAGTHDCGTCSESLRLSDLVGDEYLDVFDAGMDDFTQQLSDDLDKLSEQVLGKNDDEDGSSNDLLTPRTKARECVAALALGLA